MKSRITTQTRQAFTLVEVMIAVAIIGMMAAVVIPNIQKYLAKAKVSSTQTTMAAIKSALLDYQSDMGNFPTKREGGLDALIEKPNVKGSERWEGPYLEGQDEVPTDAWRNEFEYNTGSDITQKKFKHYEIISHGANGEEGGSGIDKDLFVGS